MDKSTIPKPGKYASLNSEKSASETTTKCGSENVTGGDTKDSTDATTTTTAEMSGKSLPNFNLPPYEDLESFSKERVSSIMLIFSCLKSFRNFRHIYIFSYFLGVIVLTFFNLYVLSIYRVPQKLTQI